MKLIKYLYALLFFYYVFNICPKCHSKLFHYKSKFGLNTYTFCPKCDKEAIENLFKTVELEIK